MPPPFRSERPRLPVRYSASIRHGIEPSHRSAPTSFERDRSTCSPPVRVGCDAIAHSCRLFTQTLPRESNVQPSWQYEQRTSGQGSVVSAVAATGSPAFGWLRFPPLSTKTLNAWAKRVSRNRRSPTEASAPGVPVSLTDAGVAPPLLAPHPARSRAMQTHGALSTR